MEMGAWIEMNYRDAPLAVAVPVIGKAEGTPSHVNPADGAEAVIRNSRSGSVLRVISPVVDDPGVIALILDARRRGVIVKCLTSLTDARKGVVTKGWDESQDLPAHHEAIRKLAKEGVLLRSPATTPHAKVIHADGNGAWFGSANLTRNSLRGNALEATVSIDETSLLAGLKAAFDDAWSASTFSMMHRSGAVSLRENRPPPSSAEELRRQKWDVGNGGQLLVSYPGGAPAMAEALADAIDQASEEVILAAMTLFQTDEIPFLGAALKRCLARGVSVRAVVRPERFELKDYPDPATERLIESGLHLLGVTGLHAKGFMIDGKFCGLQSANFNPYSLDTGCKTANLEFGIVGSVDHPVLSEWGSLIRHLADQPTHCFAHDC
ncbi:MAG: phosphatidylserine/phosphatidylglycerophosphate/cardiolipin synthase family protein [Akkermansiaceae bacterium]|nr:phosphatidylserine/phosphatidylglycerophosphate/cardiolipin synthase family protein [Akkermansiaceae bacterium]